MTVSRTFLVVLCLFFLVASFSCTKATKSDVIPLESVDQKLVEEGKLIVEEILTTFKSEIGAKHLLDTDYITPKIHGGITMNQVAFYQSYQYINIILGDLSFIELYKVRNLPYIRRMFYKLKSSESDINEVKLIIDVNEEYNLAGYYLYALDTKAMLKDKNLLPKLIMR